MALISARLQGYFILDRPFEKWVKIKRIEVDWVNIIKEWGRGKVKNFGKFNKSIIKRLFFFD